MNIKHFIGLSWVHESRDAETKRPCARLPDADRESFAVSVWRSCHGLDVSNGVHPFDGTGVLPVIAQLPDCGWTRRAGSLKAHALWKHDLTGKPEKALFRIMQNAREIARVNFVNGECYAFRAAPCNAPRPSS